MKKRYDFLLVGLFFLATVVVTIVFILTDLYDYLIVTVPLNVITGIWFIYQFSNISINEQEVYNRTLKKIVKTYDPVLVNVDSFPKLNNKSVIKTNKINDILDAQSEIRKPIYYLIGKDSTAFYLINEDIFLIYFLKMVDDIKCDLELELNKEELKSSLNLDAIKDFDKTVIVSANNKAYRVSPIRDKEEKKEDTKLKFKETVKEEVVEEPEIIEELIEEEMPVLEEYEEEQVILTPVPLPEKDEEERKKALEAEKEEKKAAKKTTTKKATTKKTTTKKTTSKSRKDQFKKGKGKAKAPAKKSK